MKKKMIALALALCLLLSLVPAASAKDSTVTVTVPGVHQHTKAAGVVRLVNEAREAEGLEPLVCCYNLTKLARQRAAEIALYCDHIRPDGSDWSTVWTDNGSDCTALAENIAMGYGEAYSVMNNWMASEESAANLLSGSYTEVGVACFQVGEILCWVQIFGTGSDQGERSFSDTGKEDVEVRINALETNLVPVEQEHYIEMPNGLAAQVDITAYENLAAGEGWHLNLVPEVNDLVAADGTVIAKTNVVPGGSGQINFKTRRQGVGTAEFPIYEGQENPVTLTVSCGAFEKPQFPEREAPTSSDSPYAHVHTPELMNVVEATCSEEGYTGDLTCTECLEVLEKGGRYMLEHTWGRWVVDGYPEWPAIGGGKHCTCTVCGTTIHTGTTAPEEPHPDGHAITVRANMHCTLHQSITAAVAGHEVFIDVIHGDHYFVKNVVITTAAGETVTDYTYCPTHSSQGILYFAMPDDAVDVYVEVEEMPKYNVILDVGEGGTATVDPVRNYEGTDTYLTVTPDEGYMIASIGIYSFGTYVPDYRYLGENRWSIQIPDGDLGIVVRFLPSENPFTDVKEENYFFVPVLWAYHNGITSGVTDTTFKPEGECTRGQVVTFLWRAAGCPKPTSTEHSFTDVDEKAYYYDAMLWAVEKGITQGVTETAFAPNKPCDRGTVVTFLHRAENCPEPETTEHPFTDVDEERFYYKAMLWAVENGITAGTSATTFAPSRTCTRGQVVTFLYRTYAQ